MGLQGGEALQVTNEKEGINQYEWSPDTRRIVFTKVVESKDDKKREEKFGKFVVEDREYHMPSLWLMDFAPQELTKPMLPQYTYDSLAREARKPKPIWKESNVQINGMLWAPDGKKIAISHQPNSDIVSFMKSDISVIDLLSKQVTPLVTNPGSDDLGDWSPDSQYILYSSAESDTITNFYKNEKLFTIQVSSKESKRIAMDFDENLGGMEWTPTGIYATANIRTNRYLYKIDPKSGKVAMVPIEGPTIYGFNLNEAGTVIAFSGPNPMGLPEVYLYNTAAKGSGLKKLTHFSDQIKDWRVAQSEVIRWKSEDGAEIEGVLHKPMDYDASKKYPLLVVIHGGPTGVDRPAPVLTYVYPINQWLNKGALVLRVNYRGSAGYGEKFRSLNVRNLGVGDAWDVLSGVDYLVKKGLVDESRMGCMGWSQGGYISAFLTTHTDKFKAISVGAGISNWMTYYVNTDIHPFTRQYLESTPWSDPDVYAKTSPMTSINNASTPTLIQHGEFDKRVPIPNAYELYQGLQDVGVPTRLIVYKGFGHGITKPKERLAAVWHNWQWFLKYVWGEEVEVPVDDK
jgi:dipeptidyl aminopeptidase/acylaminoacyl peptidase